MSDTGFTTIAHVSELDEHGRIIRELDGFQVAVFKLDSEVVAYENRCPHLAGPVGQGKVVRRVCARELADGSVEEYFSPEQVNVACPWHGYEFDLRDGTCTGDPRVRLRRYDVLIDGDAIQIRPAMARRQSVAPMPAPYDG